MSSDMLNIGGCSDHSDTLDEVIAFRISHLDAERLDRRMLGMIADGVPVQSKGDAARMLVLRALGY